MSFEMQEVIWPASSPLLPACPLATLAGSRPGLPSGSCCPSRLGTLGTAPRNLQEPRCSRPGVLALPTRLPWALRRVAPLPAPPGLAQQRASVPSHRVGVLRAPRVLLAEAGKSPRPSVQSGGSGRARVALGPLTVSLGNVVSGGQWQVAQVISEDHSSGKQSPGLGSGPGPPHLP